MSRNVSDAIVDRLGEWGIERVFGYSGDGINGLIEALSRADDGPEFVQARHEETAAFMAVGHAKFSGGVGVVISTQGPGAIHLLNGLYDAKLDGVPLVAIVGQQATTLLGSGYLQEVDLPTLFSDVASGYCQLVSSPEQIPFVIDRAFRTALATRSPSVVILPHDLQSQPATPTQQKHGAINTEPGYRHPVVLPRRSDLEQAAALLSSGRRITMLVGQGARHAEEQVAAVADRLGAALATSLLGKPFVEASSATAVGTMGHLGSTASGFAMGRCDTLLIVGSNDPWTEFYPPPGQARAVQIDIDGRFIGNRYPVEVGLVGDAAGTLDALLELLDGEADPAWRGEVEAEVSRWREISARRAAIPAEPINPEAVLRELNGRLPADARIALDVGSTVYWYARQLDLPWGAQPHLSSTLASMGCSMPYGIAGKLDRPDRPMIVLTGDGGFQMTGIAELVTVARLWSTWADPRFVVCILDNGDLAEVSWEQREMEGQPRFEASQSLPDFPAADYAGLLGLGGERVDDPAELPAAWERALSADRPYVLDVKTDPDVPLLPPFPAGREKARQMLKALDAEGERGLHAAALLREYAAHEGGLQ